jgi:hypothetical protein
VPPIIYVCPRVTPVNVRNVIKPVAEAGRIETASFSGVPALTLDGSGDSTKEEGTRLIVTAIAGENEG